jgi:uncharacterized protein YuzE
VGIVKDLSDTGKHLILVMDSPTCEEFRIPLDTIHVIEVLDARQHFAHGLNVNPGTADERLPSRRRRSRKAPAPAQPPSPVPLRVLYDETTDSLYIRLSPSERSTTKPVMLDTTLDYDTESKPVGIEFSQATKHLGYQKPVLAKLRFKLDIDEAADHLRLVLPGISKEKNVQGQEGISLGYDRDGRLAQITITAASSRLDLTQLGVRLP